MTDSDAPHFEGANAPAADAPAAAIPAVEPAEDELGRRGWRYATPILMLTVYVLGPWLLIPLAGEHAVGAVIALILGTGFAAGVADGATYRPTLSLPILAGIGFLLAKALYFNDGTFIYAIGAGLACGAGLAAGRAIRAVTGERKA